MSDVKQRVNTVNDLMVVAAEALESRDVDVLESLLALVHNWLQDNEALHAQVVMLEAMLNAAMELED